MPGKLLNGLVIMALGGDKLVDGVADLGEHVIAQQTLLKHLAVHQVVADGFADGGCDTAFLLGNDAGSEGHVDAHDVFGLMRPEQHPDGDIVGDISDYGTH